MSLIIWFLYVGVVMLGKVIRGLSAKDLWHNYRFNNRLVQVERNTIFLLNDSSNPSVNRHSWDGTTAALYIELCDWPACVDPLAKYNARSR